MSCEYKHSDVVRLWSLGPDRPQLLRHTVTGECQRLDGRWTLHVDDASGFAFLEPVGAPGQPRWVNSVLDASWHKQECGDKHEDVIWYASSNKCAAVKDLMGEARPVARTFAVGGSHFACELYNFLLPIEIADDPKSTAWWWTAPWPVDFLFRHCKKPNNRWTGRFVAGHLQEMMKCIDIVSPEAHIRASKKSIAERARHADGVLPARLAVSVEDEFSFTSHALFTWLACWGSGSMLRGWAESAGKLKQNASDLFGLLVGVILDGGSYVVHLGTSELVINDRCVRLQDALALAPPCRRRLSNLGRRNEQVPLRDFMLGLAGIAFSNSGKVESLESAQELLKGLILFLSSAMELGQSSSAQKQFDFLALPTLVGPSGKARRVPCSKKIAVCKELEVRENPAIKSAAAFVAVEAVLNKARKRPAEEMLSTVSPKTAAKYRKTAAFAYYTRSVECMQNASRISIALDGVRVGGSKLLVSALYSTDTGKGCWMAPQVLRDTKYKKSAAGAKFSEEELGDWRTRVAKVLNKTEAASAKTARQAAKKALSAPRQASLDFLLALENQLQSFMGHGLARYDLKDITESPIADGFVQFPPAAGCAPHGTPPLLVIAADQASDQCCPLAYMVMGLGLNVQQFPDPSHMSNNSSLGGTSRAGFGGLLRIAISLFNLRYGPRNNGQFMREMEDAGADISANLTPDDELVKALWPSVCEDRRWRGECETSRESCKQWLRGMACSRACSVKGPQSGSSRWYSWIHAAKFWDQAWTESLLAGAFVAISSGWVKKFTDLFGTGPAATRDKVQALAAAAAQQPASANDDDDDNEADERTAQAIVLAIADRPPEPEAASSSSSAPTGRPSKTPRTDATAAPAGGQASSGSASPGSASRSASAAPPAAPSGAANAPAHGAGAAATPAHPVAPPRASQDAASRAELKEVKEQSANSMHALLRLMSRDDIRHGCRMVCLATNPFSLANGDQMKLMLGEGGTKKIMAEWAHSGWFATLKECVRTSTNWTELERCGLSLRELKREKTRSGNPRAETEMLLQDAQYDKYFTLVFNLCREHGSSFMHYVYHYPSAAAGALHEDSTKADASMLLWKEHVDAYRGAQMHQTPQIQELLRRHPFNNTCNKLGIRFAEAAKWSKSGPQLQAWLRNLFSSMLNTVIVERSAQRLRDHETRDQTNRTMQNIAFYETLFDSSLFKEFERDEVPMLPAGSPPTTFGEQLFTPAYGKQAEKIDLHGILKTPTWPSYSAQSQKLIYAQMGALLDMHRKGDFGLAQRLWHVTILPEKQVVRVPGFDDPVLVLQVWECAALVWPLIRVASDFYQLDLEAAELRWCCLYSFVGVQVIATKVCGPMTLSYHNWPLTSGGSFMMKATGDTMGVLEWQARHGFAGVTEKALKDLASSLDVEVDTSLAKAESRENLALTLVLRVLDGASEQLATDIMVSSHMSMEAPAEECLAELTDDMIWDFALVGEQTDVLSLVKTWAEAKTTREGKRLRVKEAVTKAFPKSQETAKAGRKRTQSKAAAAKAAADLAARSNKWVAELSADARNVIVRDAPAAAHIHVDTNNGCFRVKLPHTRVKSFSWTKRGETEAARMALGFLWGAHEEVTGERAPDHLTI